MTARDYAAVHLVTITLAVNGRVAHVRLRLRYENTSPKSNAKYKHKNESQRAAYREPELKTCALPTLLRSSSVTSRTIFLLFTRKKVDLIRNYLINMECSKRIRVAYGHFHARLLEDELVKLTAIVLGVLGQVNLEAVNDRL